LTLTLAVNSVHIWVKVAKSGEYRSLYQQKRLKGLKGW
jgi:hypothetical protein